jgi:hypothetical protein
MRRSLTLCLVAAATLLLPMAAWASDQEVAEYIKANLENSGQMAHCNISGQFQHGTATLDGSVVSQDQMDLVVGIVRHTPGVKHVVNNLTVTSSAKKSGNPLRGSALANQSAKLADHRARTVSATEADISQAKAEPATGEMEVPAAPHKTRQVVYQVLPTQNGGKRMVPVAVIPAGATQPIPINTAAARQGGEVVGAPLPMYNAGVPAGPAPARYDQPQMPGYAWPSYASYPNYAAVTYPKQYSPTAWPYIGPFYPYPQVPLGWRKVTLQWDDGWWQLDFKDEPSCVWWR